MKKKVAMFCDFKFEDLEVMYPKIRLEEEGVQVDVIGVHPKGIKYTGTTVSTISRNTSRPTHKNKNRKVRISDQERYVRRRF